MLRKRCLTPANECVNPMKRDMLQGSARTSGGVRSALPMGEVRALPGDAAGRSLVTGF